jgi:hypothetical protein
MIRLLDFMLRDWKDRAAIDHANIGFFGFSAGAYTGLVLAGGNPDFRRIAPNCPESRKSLDCEQFRRGDIPSNLPHEPRIRAAVLADTAWNLAFTREGLAGIQIPLLIWRSELAGGGVDAKNSALTASRCRANPRFTSCRLASMPSCHPARRRSQRPYRAFAPTCRRASTGPPFTAIQHERCGVPACILIAIATLAERV